MRKKIFIIIYLFLAILLVRADLTSDDLAKINDSSMDEIIHPENIKKKLKLEFIKNSKYITWEYVVKYNPFQSYNDGNDFFMTFFDKYFGSAFSVHDLAFFSRYDTSMNFYITFPYLFFEVYNKTFWSGKIHLYGSFDGLFGFAGNPMGDLDNNKLTNEVYIGHIFNLRTHFKINPIDNLYLTAGYFANLQVYHEGIDKVDKYFVIQPTRYTNDFFLGISYDKLDKNEGILVKLETTFALTDKEYYWGYNNKEKVNQFQFFLFQNDVFRIPVKALNNTYFEFNIEGYYSYLGSYSYGTTKLNLDYYNPYKRWMNGYKDRDIDFNKGVKGRFLSDINFYHKEYLAKEEKNQKLLSTGFDMATYFSYDVMFFNTNSNSAEFYYDNNIINGFGLGYKFIITPVYKALQHEFIIDLNVSYGFDAFGYEHKFDRLLIGIAFLWKSIL
ncbi:MAG: hypothetical protein A2355_07870 [Spirochaetes bacterium RIFOXYB1_FULL_32_8]|nr:MAG: hypothetical protein A2Y30_01400 [Spirochaetes bacterium GWE1_32_154]OHD82612.1 MAG: hypothetical protein A2355_07870 [Spirochaetes bacterium RIFOXYB1_FULL_32_8]